MRMKCALAVGVGVGLVSGSATSAQEFHRLSEPDAVLLGEFSQIQGLRELSDGRVLLTDWIEQRLMVADFETGRVRDLHRVGSGPQEYKLPQRLIAMPGDSTLMVDQGNQRLLVIGPDLVIQRVEHGPSQFRVALTPSAIDQNGSAYYAMPGWVVGRQPGSWDSTEIRHWNREADRIEAVGRYLGSRPRSDAGQPRMTPGIPFVMFEAQDAWGVFSDGAIAFVRSADYRIEIREPSGEIRVGSPNTFEARRVSEADKYAFVERFVTSTPVIGRGGVSVGGSDASPAYIRQIVETNEFAKEMPPFLPSAVRTTPDDQLWVGRWVISPEEPQLFDVFARDGSLLGREQRSGCCCTSGVCLSSAGLHLPLSKDAIPGREGVGCFQGRRQPETRCCDSWMGQSTVRHSGTTHSEG